MPGIARWDWTVIRCDAGMAWCHPVSPTLSEDISLELLPGDVDENGLRGASQRLASCARIAIPDTVW